MLDSYENNILDKQAEEKRDAKEDIHQNGLGFDYLFLRLPQIRFLIKIFWIITE